MNNQKITVLTISDSTGTQAPLAGANGELGRLALKSDVDNVTAGMSVILNGSSDAITSLTTVSHQAVDINTSYPIVSLTAPTSSTILFVQAVTNRTSTSFDVVLSSTPTTGYKVNWQMVTTGNGFVAKAFGVQTISGSITSEIYPDGSNKDTKDILIDADITLKPPVNMADGQVIILKTTQDYIGGHTITCDSSYKFPGGISVQATSAANSTDIWTILKVGSNYFTSVAQDLY